MSPLLMGYRRRTNKSGAVKKGGPWASQGAMGPLKAFGPFKGALAAQGHWPLKGPVASEGAIGP